MSDNKKYTGKGDRIRVDSQDPSEVEYLHSRHPLFSHEEIRNAIKSVGPFRDDIEAHLQKNAKKNPRQ